MSTLIELTYFVAAVVFILGLKRMSSPVTARSGIVWAGFGMIAATVVTFLTPDMGNYMLMVLAIAIGGVLAWWSGKRVAMTDMPQMIALYNGLGGGAAAAIAGIELLKVSKSHAVVGSAVAAISGGGHSNAEIILGIIGAVIGTVAFSGSLIAWAKLDGRIKKAWRLPMANQLNMVLGVATVALGVLVFAQGNEALVGLFFFIAFIFGILVTLPIGGADMPVIISLFNALTGLAVAFEGFVLGNSAMIIAGTVVGSSGTLLTQLMAKAMNRSLANVLFSGFGSNTAVAAEGEAGGEMKAIEANDVGVMMAFASQVIIVPGYGMAVAQAQHKVWEMAQLLIKKDVTVKFAIHPVAGRMPGHMNVLLAEAGVPYDMIVDMDDINPEFKKTQVTLVIGANDVVNPAARNDPASPIYGMPILDVDNSDNVIVIKRGTGAGFSGLENSLFFADNTRMLFGDGQAMVAELIHSIKEL